MLLMVALWLCAMDWVTSAFCAVTSNSTPSEVKALFPSAILLDTVPAVLSASDIDILIDATYEALQTNRLTALSKDTQVPLLVLGPVERTQLSNWVYYLSESPSQVASAIDTVIRYLGAPKVSLVQDTSAYSQHLVQALLTRNSSVHYETRFVTREEPVEAFVGKVLRPQGNRITVFTTHPVLTKALLKAQFSMHIGGAGYCNLLPFHSSLFILDPSDTEDNLKTGNLIVAEAQAALLTSTQEAAAQLYSQLSAYFQTSSSEAKVLLDSAFPSHHQHSDFVLVNLRNSSRSVVGEIQGERFTLRTPIIFLGNVTSLAQSSAAIQLSGSFADTDPVMGYIGGSAVTIAALMAFDEINASPTLIPNFRVQVWNFSAGVILPDIAALSRVVLPQKDRLGAAILTNIGSLSAMPMIQLLRQQNVSTPVVGATTSHPDLSSQKNYPNFVRVSVSDTYVNIVIVQTIKHLGWKKCALLVSYSPAGLTTQQSLQALLPSSGIEIVNHPEYQTIAYNVSSMEEARANYTPAFQHIIDTKCRVLLAVNIVTWDFLTQVFYELGMRKGDLTIIGRGWIVPFSFENLTAAEAEQTSEVMFGSIQFSPEFFVGPVGQSFETRFAEVTHLPPIAYACQYYDAAYAIAHTLHWLLLHGKDFYNSTDMMKRLRQVRFQGCTGLVSFEAGTNDRQSMRYTLSTLKYNESAGLYLQQVGVYDPTGMLLLSLDSHFVWASDTRLSTLGCPFEDRLNKQFPAGRTVVIIVSLALFLFTALVSLLVWRYFAMPLPSLLERKQITSDDTLIMIDMLIETLQSLALSTDLSFISEKLRRLLSLGIGNFPEVNDLKDGKFMEVWVLFECCNVCFLVGLALLLWCPFCRRGHGVSATLLDLGVYVCAHWLLVPNLLLLLNVFVCVQGVAEVGSEVTFTSSYLAADCYMPCWQGTHLLQVVTSAVFVLIYVATAVTYRPLWQASRSTLNVHTDLRFLCSTPTFQTLLLALFLGIQKEHAVVHSCICLGLWALRFLVTLRTKSYNYKRYRVRRMYLTAAGLWSVVLCLCSQVTSASEWVLGIVFCVGTGLIVLVGEGLTVLLIPGLLYRPVGVNTVYLFRFAFKPATHSIVDDLQREFALSRSPCSIRLESREVPSEAQVLGV